MKTDLHFEYKQLIEKQKVLMALDKNYTIKVINGNYELISETLNHKTRRKFTYTSDELLFIRSVRQHILKNEIYSDPKFTENQLFPEDVHYIKVARVPIGKTFDNVCEVDINQAYWETAYLLGIVDEKIYRTGSKGNISKQARLTALGSLAKKTYLHHFKGVKLIETSVNREPLLENLWFTICKRVSDVMHEVIEAVGKDFIFYWVDGIYMTNTPENVTKAMTTFLNKGYTSKFKMIKQIYFHEKGFSVNDTGDIKREFNFPNYDTKEGKIDYIENIRLSKLANEVMNQKIDLKNDF